MRQFQKISEEQWAKDIDGYEGAIAIIPRNNLLEPRRATKHSAGYDFISPIGSAVRGHETAKIPTGIKVAMEDGEVLMMYPRSSMGFKTNIRFANTTGVIDADYYNNPQNEGHIWIKFYNPTDEDYYIKAGDKVAQGIFIKYLTVDNEEKIINERTGGFGSTDKRI